MERLFIQSRRRVQLVDNTFKRYLLKEIDWEQKLIIIKGARGTGKTTMILQQMIKQAEKSIYLSLDDFYFEKNRLVLLVESLYEMGYRNFYLDEVHQYEYWSKDIKNSYDSFKDIKIVATGSSILQLDKGQADLSRRAAVHTLHGLSFREFLELEYKVKLPSFSLKEIIDHHPEISSKISDKVGVNRAFAHYLNYGYYPFFKNGKKDYHQKLQQIAHLTTEIDIPRVENINYATIRGMKKLLYVVSQIVPFTPNISQLAEKVDTTRTSVLKMLDYLEKGSIVQLLRASNVGVSYLQKPEKIFLNNPNLAYTFSGEKPNVGNLRETFFYNQTKIRYDVTSSKFGDFMLDKQYTFEIGGPTKTGKQIQGIPLAYIAADGIKHGQGNKIPLWLFGFLY